METPNEESIIILKSPDGAAELLIHALDSGWAPSLDDLRNRVPLRAKELGLDVRDVSCGDFSGVQFDYVDEHEGSFNRESKVSLAELVLVVCFGCPANTERRYLADVTRILDSFRLNRS